MQCVVMGDDVMRRSYRGEGIEPPRVISQERYFPAVMLQPTSPNVLTCSQLGKKLKCFGQKGCFDPYGGQESGFGMRACVRTYMYNPQDLYYSPIFYQNLHFSNQNYEKLDRYSFA